MSSFEWWHVTWQMTWRLNPLCFVILIASYSSNAKLILMREESRDHCRLSLRFTDHLQRPCTIVDHYTILTSNWIFKVNIVWLQDKHFKKIQSLEILMNITRHEAEKANWQHSTTLWSAGNFTVNEFRRVWTAVNVTEAVLSRKIGKVRNNFARKVIGSRCSWCRQN